MHARRLELKHLFLSSAKQVSTKFCSCLFFLVLFLDYLFCVPTSLFPDVVHRVSFWFLPLDSSLTLSSFFLGNYYWSVELLSLLTCSSKTSLFTPCGLESGSAQLGVNINTPLACRKEILGCLYTCFLFVTHYKQCCLKFLLGICSVFKCRITLCIISSFSVVFMCCHDSGSFSWI